MRKQMMTVAVVMALVLGLAGMAMAETLTGNHALGDVLNFTDDGDGVHSITRNGSTFWWADPDGNGLADTTAASAGLNMNSSNITRQDSDLGITLNLDHTGDGSLGGSITNGGSILTDAPGWNDYVGVVTITNAADINVDMIDTSSQNKTPVGGLTVSHTGNLTTNSIVNDETYYAQNPVSFNGNQHGTAVSNIFNAGTISSRGLGSYSVSAAGDVTIQNYHSVQVTGAMSPGGDDTRTYGIVANGIGRNPDAGTVQITNIGAGGVSVPSGINTGNSSASSSWSSQFGDIEIHTAGPVVLGHLFTGSAISSSDNGGNVTVTGASIVVTGDIVMQDTNTTGGNGGILDLTATAGTILIGVEGSATPEIDLKLLDYATFDATGNTMIYGLIRAEDGFAADGVTTGSHQIGTGLQAPTGQFVYYNPTVNPDLLVGSPDGTYILTGGGTLAAFVQPPVPEPAGLGLLGLAALGLKRRRS